MYNQYHAYFAKSEDCDGWIAHCLEIDCVTQGNSLNHAMEMLLEALSLYTEEEIKLCKGAPEEYWNEGYKLVKHKNFVLFNPYKQILQLNENKIKKIIGYASVHYFGNKNVIKYYNDWYVETI